MGKAWDGTGVAFKPETWREVYRVLKPGAHLLAFGGARTFHRMTCAIEDAGFEIRDCLSWLYGSGFPKSLDVSKAIDKKSGADISWFGPWLRQERERRGIPQKELAKHFPSKSGGLTGCVANWELGCNLPTSDQFKVLCRLLDLPPFYGIEEAEREAKRDVIGSRNKLDSFEFSGNRVYQTGGNKGVVVIEETAPSTDAAKQWDGWGTALKPAWEPVIVARKRFDGSVVANVLTHGTGALNIDACRIECDPDDLGDPNRFASTKTGSGSWSKNDGGMFDPGRRGGWVDGLPPAGRWPPNVLLDEIAAAQLDQMTGDLGGGARVVGGPPRQPTRHIGQISGLSRDNALMNYGDTGGASRFFYCAKPSREERDFGCYGLPAKTGGEATDRKDGSDGLNSPRAVAGRNGGSRNHHATVKPVELIRWLVRLVTPPGGTVLDPFLGSGTTGMACRYEHREFIGIEREAEYIEIAKRRIAAVAPLFFTEEDSA